MFTVNKKIILGLILSCLPLFADVAPKSSASSGGIVDFYFTSSNSGSEVPKVYVDVQKIKTEVNAIMGYFPRSKQYHTCFGQSSDICPKDAAQCNATNETPTCPAGGSLETVRDMCQAEPAFVCGAGYTFDASIDRCIKSVICPDGGTFNAVTDRCEKLMTPTCPVDYTLDIPNSVCWKTVDCGVDATFNPTKDRCEKPISIGCSDPSYSYNPTTYQCERAPSCSAGVYNAIYNKCLTDYVAQCDTANGYSLNSTSGNCEKAPPQCPTNSSYNSTTNRCEGASACVAPAVWNGTQCQSGGTSTYAATATTTFEWDNCDGNRDTQAKASTYCQSKGMRLPTSSETSAAGGAAPSCLGWTWTSSIVATFPIMWQPGGMTTNDDYGFYSVLPGGGYIRCVGNTTTYACNPGDPAPVGTTCTTSTPVYAAGTCANTSLTPDPTTGTCVANPTCPIAAGYGASTYDETKDHCWAPIKKDCSSIAGTTYDSASNKCVKNPDCTSGLLDTSSDKCYQSACPSGYTFNTTTKICEVDPSCANGTYNTTYDKCLLAFTAGCDTVQSYAYNSGRTQCERTPQCPADSSYNSTTNRCEGASACVAPAVWNSVAQTCVTNASSVAPARKQMEFADGLGDCSHTSWYTGYPTAWLTAVANTGGDGQVSYALNKPIVDHFWANNGLPASSVSSSYGLIYVPASNGDIGLDTGYGYGGYRVGTKTSSDSGYVCRYPDSCRCDRPSLYMRISYVCDAGVLSGTTCTTSTVTQAAGTCANASLTPDPTTGVCVANPTCPASLGWSPSFDGAIDQCKTTYTKDCLVSGMAYDSASNMCAKDAACASAAALNKTIDKCVLSMADCGAWAYDTPNQVCYSPAACLNGAYNTSIKQCEASIAPDCNTYVWNATDVKCTSVIACPIDASFSEKDSMAYSSTLDKCVSNTQHDCLIGYVYNGLPILKCEAVPVCIGGIYNPLNDSCYLGDLTCPIGNYQCRISSGTDRWCGPYDCAAGKCGIATCPDLVSATAGASDSSACFALACDISKPYNGYCGQSSCPKGFGVYKESGNCYQDVCPSGSIQQANGSCQKLQCPAGSTEAGGICLMN